MNRPRAAAGAAVATALAVVGAVVAPYLSAAAGVSTYYDTWLVGPELLVLLVLVAVVALVGGLRGQTPHETVAGTVVALATVGLVVAVGWAASVPADLPLQLGRGTWLGYHRWVVVALTAAFAAATGVYAGVVLR